MEKVVLIFFLFVLFLDHTSSGGGLIKPRFFVGPVDLSWPCLWHVENTLLPLALISTFIET